MNSVSTQTYNTKEISTQVNNINFIIEENTSSNIFTNMYSNSFDCMYNKIMKGYHKKINEKGHSILIWRDYDKIHSKIAKETIQQLQNANINPPFWLISRANKIIT
jgi:hypothetical protein